MRSMTTLLYGNVSEVSVPADISNNRRVNRMTGGVPVGGTAKGLNSLRVGSASTRKSQVNAAVYRPASR
jgi:hypothetical protein